MMSVELTFGAAIIVGLLGSSHCIGMCGGIVGALNMGVEQGPTRRALPLFVYHLAYNAGRVSSYLLIGLLAGSLGAGLMELGVSPLAGRLTAAAFMVALGLYLANWWRGLAILEKMGFRLWRHIQPIGKRLFPIRNPFQAVLLGMLWGWLPCGLVYAAVAWSMTTGDAVQGAILMAGFGIGTLPALLIAGNLFQSFSHIVRSPAIRTAAGALMIIFGLYSGFAGVVGSHQHHQHQHQETDARLATDPHPGVVLTRVPAIFCSMA